MRRLAAGLAALALGLGAGGCGSGDPGDGRVPTPGAGTPGTGDVPLAEQVTVFNRGGDAATVLFLHGWGATEPRLYRAWIDHLTGQGHTVVFPRYQESFATPPAEVLPNLVNGLRRTFAGLDVEDLVVVGHSAGGALAADYAAVAGAAGLPLPEAIMLAYPGRAARGLPGRIPELGDDRIPASVDIVALGSRGDRVVGTRVAREVVRDAGHGRYVEVTTPGATDHLAPQRATPAARRVFWDALDRLLRPGR